MKHMAPPADDLRERFILFLASKPADKRYFWKNPKHCACGTFIREVLSERVTRRPLPLFPWLKFTKVERRNQMQENEVWRRWNHVAMVGCRTYGALLERVRAS